MASFKRDAVIALSLANLNLLPLWRLLVFESTSDDYYIVTPTLAIYVGGILCCAILCAVIFAILRLLSNDDSRLHAALRLALIAVLLINPLNFVRTAWKLFTVGAVLGAPEWQLAMLATLGAASGALALVFARRVIPVLNAALLILSPLALMTVAQAAWIGMTTPAPVRTIRTIAPPLGEQAVKQRVVWLLFDGLDNRIFRGEKPDDVSLPEFDRLVAQSLVATNARRASPGRTLTNVPGMMLGREVTRAVPQSGDVLMLEFGDGTEPVSWSEQPHLFAEARRRGASVSIVSFYHPLCRVLAGSYDRCSSFPMESIMPTLTPGLIPAMRAEARVLTPLYQMQNAVATHEAIVSAAKETLEERPLALTFIHLSVPHTPQIWDRKRNAFRSGLGFFRADYRDNFALADRALGKIRSAMERSGIWDDSVVLVTSDHGFDEWDNRWSKVNDEIAFLLKLPSQSRSRIHTAPFRAVVVKELLLALQQGELEGSAAVSAWLAEHRDEGDSRARLENSPIARRALRSFYWKE